MNHEEIIEFISFLEETAADKAKSDYKKVQLLAALLKEFKNAIKNNLKIKVHK